MLCAPLFAVFDTIVCLTEKLLSRSCDYLPFFTMAACCRQRRQPERRRFGLIRCSSGHETIYCGCSTVSSDIVSTVKRHSIRKSNPIAIDSDMFQLSNTAPQRFRAVLTQALTLYYQPALQRCIARTTLTLSFTCCFIQNRAPLLHWIVTSTDKNLFLSLYPTPQYGEENTLFCKILRNLAPILFSPRTGFKKITLITLSTRFTA